MEYAELRMLPQAGLITVAAKKAAAATYVGDDYLGLYGLRQIDMLKRDTLQGRRVEEGISRVGIGRRFWFVFRC